MSLILEALRKSEAERRRGQVPGLHAELPPAAQTTRSRRAPWPWLLAMALIAVATATWWMYQGRAPTPVIGETPLTSTQRAAPADGDHNVVDTADATMVRTDTAVAVTGATSSPTDTTARPARPRNSAERPPDIVEPAPPTAAAAAPGGNAKRSRPRVSGATQPLPVVRAPRPAEPVTMPARTTPADATATAADDTAPLRLSDLSAAERRALPPLQVSMHMWAPTSARRFAIIDGARVNEGDRLGEAVVDEITRDGVVLAWHGRRVHIPIH